MPFSEFGPRRLAQQGLAGRPFASPAEVVYWLGAVQAQDYLGAKWSLGMRMANATDDTVERAFNAGEILRTHIMRPTWHFVSPADIRWMQALTSPRVNAGNAYMYRQLGLDEALLLRCNDLLARILAGGKQLTRAELGAALAQAGVEAGGQRLGYIIHRAELDALLCSGPRRGKQFTYMLLAERAPHARTLPLDEALAELTLRYFTGHGPASVRDFAWWSGLTIAGVKAGIDMVAGHLSSEVTGGQAYYYSSATPPPAMPAATLPARTGPSTETGQTPAGEQSPAAFLLPTYDEYLIGYANFDRSRTAGQELREKLVFDSTIAYGGRIIGTWRRTFQKGGVVIELAPFAPFTRLEEQAVADAAQRYGEFVGLPVEFRHFEEVK